MFLGVDEEGGTVARIASNSAFGVTDVGNMSDVGATGDSQNAYNAGSTIGTYLNTLGFNMDFAPVADVLTNPDNTVIKDRSFGSDSQLVADMVCAEMQGLNDQHGHHQHRNADALFQPHLAGVKAAPVALDLLAFGISCHNQPPSLGSTYRITEWPVKP